MFMHIKKQFTNIKKGIEYVLRYSSKPAMAESRITNIDYKNDTIEMTCKRCKKKHDMPYDIYMEMLEYADPFEEMEFIVIECVY